MWNYRHQGFLLQSMVEQEIMKKHSLHDKAVDVHLEIHGEAHELPLAWKLAHDNLVEFLSKHGYKPVKCTPGLWTHDTRKISFALVVDDFGVKFTKDKDY